MTSEDKPTASGNDLKSLVKQQFQRISAAAVSKGEVSDEDLLKLRQLSELDASLPKAPAHPAPKWPVILLSLGIFLVPGVMISIKVPSIEVQLNLLVSKLSWHQQQAGEIMGHIALDSLGANSFGNISLPRTWHAGEQALTVPPANFWLPESGNGKISLAPIDADSGTRVWLSKSLNDTTASLSMMGPKTRVTANLSGTVGIDAGGSRLGERDFGLARQVNFEATEPNLLDLTLKFDGKQNISFPSHIIISSLSLQEIEDVVVNRIRTKKNFSTVLEGEVYNESMNGKKYPLRKGEWLLVDGIEGEIRSMQLTDDGIRLDYHGKVTSISVGSNQNQRDLMPSWLEWFSERHSVKMLWGAFLWLLTTLFGVINWWRRPH